MRTTLQIEDDILEAARAIAQDRNQSIGATISFLARKGLAADHKPARKRSGFPVFKVPSDAKPITPAMVKRWEDAG